MNVCFPLFIPSIINYDLKKPFILLRLAVLRLLQFYFLRFMRQNKEREEEQERMKRIDDATVR